MPNYQTLRDQAIYQLPDGWKGFAGQADDPFFLDLRVFDLLYGGDLSEVGQDTLAGYNVNTIALQVPIKDVALKGDASRNPVIGVWSTTERQRPVRVGRRRRSGRLGPGLAPRQPARQRGGRAGRAQGRVQRDHARQGRRHPGRRRPGDQPRGAAADRGDLRHSGPADAAQRPGGDLPDRHHDQGRRSRSRPT